MPEQKVVQKPTLDFKGFLKMALNSVQEGIEEIKGKGVGVRLDADYCNSIVSALKEKFPDKFGKYSDTEVKLALKPLFKATIMNAVAENLGIIQE